MRRESVYGFDGLRVCVGCEDFEALLCEIDEVAAGAATCVEYTHSGCNPATQQLIE